jgi:glycosyltransferase involved in cell wall biosynthesis
MKVAIFISGFKKDNIRALPWKYAYEISKGLSYSGYDTYILTNTNEQNSWTLFETNHETPVISYYSFLRLGLKSLSGIIKHLKPDVIYYFSPPIGSLELKYLTSRKLIIHVGNNIQSMAAFLRSHGISFNMLSPSNTVYNLLRHSVKLAKIYTSLLTRDSILRYDFVNVTTESIKESLINIGYRSERIRCFPPVVDDIFLTYDSARTRNIRETYNLNDNFVAIYFGAANPRKGVFELITALPLIKKKIPKFKLLLLLRPPFVEDFMIKIKKLIIETKYNEDVIIIARLIDPLTLIDFLNCSDVVVLPFKYLDEEPPLTLLEAMALGKAIITTEISCVKHIIGKDRGILLNYPHPPLIAQAVYSLYRDESKKNFLEKNCKDFASTTFVSWDYLVQMIESELKSS